VTSPQAKIGLMLRFDVNSMMIASMVYDIVRPLYFSSSPAAPVLLKEM